MEIEQGITVPADEKKLKCDLRIIMGHEVWLVRNPEELNEKQISHYHLWPKDKEGKHTHHYLAMRKEDVQLGTKVLFWAGGHDWDIDAGEKLYIYCYCPVTSYTPAGTIRYGFEYKKDSASVQINDCCSESLEFWGTEEFGWMATGTMYINPAVYDKIKMSK